MEIIRCTAARHAAAILDILNEAIANSTSVYDYEPRTIGMMQNWFADRQAGNFPVIGIEDSAGTLLGYASYGVFRARPAYKYSVEHSLYVHVDHRGKGLGRILLQQIIDTATSQNYHLLVGGIDTSNTTSIALHERFGFSHAGTVRQAGFKFGRWLDLALYQLILPTPANPVDR
jgi:phosphinothricin acetyltransferase